MGGTDIEWYRKRFPEMIKICVVCYKEFVPKIEGRAQTALTCSMECSNEYNHCNTNLRKSIRNKAAQLSSSRSRGGEKPRADDRDPVSNEIKKE
jgi:hypothetical protein